MVHVRCVLVHVLVSVRDNVIMCILEWLHVCVASPVVVGVVNGTDTMAAFGVVLIPFLVYMYCVTIREHILCDMIEE